MTFQEILSNSKYGDDMVLSLPDGSAVKVGDVRSYTATERQEIVGRAQKLQDAEAALTTRVTKLRTAGLLDENMNPVVNQPSDREVRKAITSNTGIDEDDPLFGPLLKQVKAELSSETTALRQELEKITNQVKLIGNVTQQGVKGYLDDHYDRAFSAAKSGLPESVRDKVSLKDALELAEKKKLTDGLGRFDIALAVDQLSWPHVKEAQRKEMDGTKNQLEEDKKVLAQIGRPGSSGPKRADTGFKGVDDKGKTLSLDDALAAAANDSELWNSAAAYLQ
jgi:hypothetical protein